MKTSALPLLLLPLALAACSHTSKRDAPQASATATSPAPQREGPHGMAALCPMDVPGTKVSASDTADGEAVTFTTSADQVPALRERVRAMAKMHDQHHAGGAGGMPPGHGGHAGMEGHGGMTGHPAGMPMPPPSRTSVEDVEGGARLVVTPNDPADLAKLQSAVRMHAEHMQQQGGCGMGAPR